jgi:hypothetical protein
VNVMLSGLAALKLGVQATPSDGAEDRAAGFGAGAVLAKTAGNLCRIERVQERDLEIAYGYGFARCSQALTKARAAPADIHRPSHDGRARAI